MRLAVLVVANNPAKHDLWPKHCLQDAGKTNGPRLDQHVPRVADNAYGFAMHCPRGFAI